MYVIKTDDMTFNGVVSLVDEKMINRLIQESMRMEPYYDSSDLYNKFYNSKYQTIDVSRQELELKKYLQTLTDKYGSQIKTGPQGIEYEWIMINFDYLDDIMYRFYFGLNPIHMHDVVKFLSTEFLKNGISVAFKYQQKFKMTQCDRIIIYSDCVNKDKIEAVISDVYKVYPTYFADSERSLAWIYESVVPNVYLTPETKGFSYGQRFSEIMLEAKFIFCYLYGSKDKSLKTIPKIDECIKEMNRIIKILLFRNGLLLTVDSKNSILKDIEVKINYDYNTQILTSYAICSNDILEVNFLPTIQGKEQFLNSFDNLFQIKKQDGVELTCLSKEEFNQKTYIKRL